MNHTLLNNQERARQLRIRVENITILLLAVFSFFLFLLTFFPFSRISKAMQGSFEMGRMVQRAFSIVLFVLSLQLWKRKRNAWTIAVGIFVLNFLRGLIGMGHPLHNLSCFSSRGKISAARPDAETADKHCFWHFLPSSVSS